MKASTKYLILNDIGAVNSDPAPAWAGATGTNLIAKANDIIQFNGTTWYIAFNSATEQELNIVTNANTMLKYKWVDGEWIDVYQGIYKEGYWRLYL